MDAIIVKLRDGSTVTLTEKSLMQIELARVDATAALPAWMQKKVEELRAAAPRSSLPTRDLTLEMVSSLVWPKRLLTAPVAIADANGLDGAPNQFARSLNNRCDTLGLA